MKTPARLLTGHGKSSKANVCRIFLKESVVGEKLILPSDYKTISFEKFILWEIAARKLWYRKSLLLTNNKGTYRTAMMSKPAYLSVEIVIDKPTPGKIYIPQVQGSKIVHVRSYLRAEVR